MVKDRVTPSGVSTSLAEKRGTGTAYAECLLSELKQPDLATWLAGLTPKGDEALRAGVSTLLVHMEKKVFACEPWRNGPWKGTDTQRAIKMSHINELMFSLRACINASRASCGRVTVLSDSWFGEIASYKSLKAAMTAKFASEAKAKGKELEQRREHMLTDYQRLDMYRSMLSLSVRSSHLASKARPDAARKAVTTLTLCLMVSLYSAIGQRGLNLDDLVWGGLQLAGWTTSYQWAGYKPTLLQVSTGFKGGGAGSVKLFQIMPHRDVMQCSISMLGLYFLYQFILLVDPLPSIKGWIATGHNASLFRKQTQSSQDGGGVRAISSYNLYLKEELEAVGADPAFTFHSFRNARIADAGTDHCASRPDIMHGAGHSTGGSHSVSYNAVDASWVLSGAGYRGSEPEMLAPQVKLLELYRHEGEHCDDAEELLELVFSSRKDEWGSLRDAASFSNDEDGAKARRWIDVVRYSVLSFLVGCAFRPRDRFGVIDIDMPIKQKLLGDEIVSDARIKAIFESDAFARLLERAARFQQAEVEVGELANVGAQERRVRSQIAGMENRLSSLPTEVASCVAPALDEEAQLRLDGEWLQRHNAERMQFCGSSSRLDEFSPCGLQSGDPRLRQMRLEAEEGERKRAREQTNIQHWFGPPVHVQMAVGCDLCRADGIPASSQCPHLPKRQRIAGADSAPPAPSSVEQQAAGGAAAEDELLRKVAVLEAEKAELTRKLGAAEELNRNLKAAAADPAKEASTSATVPQIRTLKNVQHLLKVYLQVVGPLELHHAWRLPPQVNNDEADRRKRLVAAYVNVVVAVLHACEKEDFSDVWQAAERTERRKMTFTALANETKSLPKERRTFITGKLKDSSLFARLLSLLQEVPEPPPAPPPAAIVEATAASSSTDPLTRFYVAFDPSMTTGVVRFTVQDDTLTSIKLGLLRLPPTGSSGSRCLSLLDMLPQWVDDATHAFVEPYFAHASAVSGAALNYEIRGALKMALARASVEHTEVPSGKWKKAVAKKGDATKAEARAAVERMLAISLPPCVNNDTSDALCIGVCGLMEQRVRLVGAVAVEVA